VDVPMQRTLAAIKLDIEVTYAALLGKRQGSIKGTPFEGHLRQAPPLKSFSEQLTNIGLRTTCLSAIVINCSASYSTAPTSRRDNFPWRSPSVFGRPSRFSEFVSPRRHHVRALKRQKGHTGT